MSIYIKNDIFVYQKQIIMDSLFTTHNRILDKLRDQFVRPLEAEINWNSQLIALQGARGVGKTTLFLKYIKKHYKDSTKALYVSLDHLYFSSNTLLDFANDFYKQGGRHLFIDEVHKYPNWSRELKNIYDGFPDLKVAFTSSSILEILKGNADLSRRVVIYDLKGLSFREYLNITTGNHFDKYSLNDIVTDHIAIARKITKQVQPFVHWKNYLTYGYYPFYLEGQDMYNQRLMNVINITLDTDLVQCRHVEYSYINKLKKLLYMVAVSPPMQPNIAKLSQTIEASRATITQYFDYLRDAQLVNLLKSDKKGYAHLAKAEKVYLHNTNLSYSIAPEAINPGNMRETFFFNQVGAFHKLSHTDKADFLVDGKYIFEIGGKNKTDYGNKIPLWLFGFLY
jgi:predicted AAA+ superfamily ATPase